MNNTQLTREMGGTIMADLDRAIKVTQFDIVDHQMIYEKSSLAFMNPNTRSNEVYFGNDNDAKHTVISHVKEIRGLYASVQNTSNKKKARQAFGEEVMNELKVFEKDLCKMFNLEKCSIGLFDGENAFALPMCWDSELVDEVGKGHGGRFSTRWNDTHRLSLEDIVETKDGFKFVNPKGKHFILAFGVQFYDLEYTDEEIAGILFHELGHCFQHMLAGINHNLWCIWTKNLFDIAYNYVLHPFGWIYQLMFLNSANADAKRRGKIGQSLGNAIMGSDPIGMSRSELARVYTGKDRVQGMMNRKADREDYDDTEDKILEWIGGIFEGIFKPIIEGIMALSMIINVPANLFQLVGNSFLQKNKKWEQFADHFTQVYGLGVAQASALSRLGKKYHGCDLKTMNWLNYVPVLNLAIAFNHFVLTSHMNLMNGYPDTEGRIAGIYETCKYELANNKDLTPAQRKDLEHNMDEIARLYENYVRDLSPGHFVYGIFARMFNDRVQGRKTDIKQNVLEDMKKIHENKTLQDKLNAGLYAQRQDEQPKVKNEAEKPAALTKVINKIVDDLNKNPLIVSILGKNSTKPPAIKK